MGQRGSGEVTVEQGNDLSRFDVPHDGDIDIGRNIVGRMKPLGVLSREALEVAHVTYDGLLVRMGEERRGAELFYETPARAAIGAQAALFHDDVALFVKLAENRVEEPIGFEASPELDLIRWQGVKVNGGIGAGGGIQAHAAFAIDNFAELVLDHELIGLLLSLFPGLFQGLELG